MSLGLGLGLALLAPSAAGQSDPAAAAGDERLLLQEIPSVYSASKHEQKVTQAPSSVTIVTADEIKRFGYRTLAEILRSVRGFYTSYDRNYTYLGVRGFERPGDYNSRVLLLIDGHRINDAVYDGVLVGTEFLLDVDLIDRVEVVRGPSSSLYGNNAFFGVVNVITRRGRDLGGLEVAASAGNLDTYTGRVTYGHRVPAGIEGILSGSLYRSAGQRRLFFREFDDPSTNGGIASNRDGDRAFGLFGTATYGDLTLQAIYSGRTKTVPTASYETLFNRREETEDYWLDLDLRYERSLGLDWSVLARLYYDRYQYRGLYLYAADDGTLRNRDSALGERVGGDLQVTTRLVPGHVLTAGVSLIENLSQDQRNYDIDPFTVYLDTREDSLQWGLYLQDEFALLPTLTLSAGVRYDRFEAVGSSTNPRAGLIWEPWTDTVLKALYGTAFRAPNSYERFYESPPLQANPTLRPETITTYELVLEQYLWGWLRGTAVAFYYEIDRLIEQQADRASDLLVFRNSGGSSSKGFEVELEGRWASGLLGRLSYVYQDARDDATGRRLSDSPAHQVKVHLAAPLLRDRVFAALEVLYESSRRTITARALPDVVLTNVTLWSTNLPWKGLELSASVYNLFDKSYAIPVSDVHRQDAIEQDGRSFRLKLTYAF